MPATVVASIQALVNTGQSFADGNTYVLIQGPSAAAVGDGAGGEYYQYVTSSAATVDGYRVVQTGASGKYIRIGTEVAVTSMGDLRTALDLAAKVGAAVRLVGGGAIWSFGDALSEDEILVPAGTRLTVDGPLTVRLRNPSRGFLLVQGGSAPTVLDLRGLSVIGMYVPSTASQTPLPRPDFAWPTGNSTSQYRLWVDQWNAVHSGTQDLSTATETSSFKDNWNVVFSSSKINGLGNAASPNRNAAVIVLDASNVTIIGGYAENLNAGISLLGESSSQAASSRNILIDGFEANGCDMGVLAGQQSQLTIRNLYFHDGTNAQSAEPHAIYLTGDLLLKNRNTDVIIERLRVERARFGEAVKIKTTSGALINGALLRDTAAGIASGQGSEVTATGVVFDPQRLAYTAPGKTLGGGGKLAFRANEGSALNVNDWFVRQAATPGPLTGRTSVAVTGVIPPTLTGNVVTNPPVVQNLTSDPRGTGWQVGLPVIGAGIAPGTTVEALTSDTLTLSKRPLVAGTGVTVKTTAIAKLSRPPFLAGWFPGVAIGIGTDNAILPAGTTLVSVPAFTLAVTGTVDFLTDPMLVKGVAETSGITIGAPVSGDNIALGTVVDSVPSGSQFRLSIPAIAQISSGIIKVAGSRKVKGQVSSGSNTITIPSNATLEVGMSVIIANPAVTTTITGLQGTQVITVNHTFTSPSNPTITIEGNAAVLSAPAVSAAGTSQTFSSGIIDASLDPVANGWFAGMVVGFAGGAAFKRTTVTSLAGLTLATSGKASVGSSYITAVSTLVGVTPGMLVTGSDIQADTLVAAVDPEAMTLTLTKDVASSVTGVDVAIGFTIRGNALGLDKRIADSLMNIEVYPGLPALRGKLVKGDSTVTNIQVGIRAIASTTAGSRDIQYVGGSGWAVGDPVFGRGVDDGSVLSNVLGGIDLSKNATVTASGSLLTAFNTSVTLANSGYENGDGLVGEGISVGTTVTVNANTLTLSAPALADIDPVFLASDYSQDSLSLFEAAGASGFRLIDGELRRSARTPGSVGLALATDGGTVAGFTYIDTGLSNTPLFVLRGDLNGIGGSSNWSIRDLQVSGAVAFAVMRDMTAGTVLAVDSALLRPGWDPTFSLPRRDQRQAELLPGGLDRKGRPDVDRGHRPQQLGDPNRHCDRSGRRGFRRRPV